MTPVFGFLLFLGLVNASIYKRERIKPPQVITIERDPLEISKAIFKMPFTKNYRTYDQTFDLPEELWQAIVNEVDPRDLWNLGLANKFFGAFIRTEGLGHVERMKKMEVLEHIIYTSDLNLKNTMWHAWVEADKHQEVLRAHMADVEKYHYDPTYKRVLERITDTAFLLQLVAERFRMKSGLLIPEVMRNQLFKLEGWRHGDLVWVPTAESPKLFEIVSPQQCLAISMINVQANPALYLRDLIVPALIAQYIIPQYKTELVLTQNEIDGIRLLAPFLCKPMSKYFTYLHWALYYQTNSVNIKHIDIGRIERSLRLLGFSWKKLVQRPLTAAKRNETKTELTEADQINIIKVAKQWGLNLDQIVSNTAGFSTIGMNLFSQYTTNTLPVDYNAPCDAFTVAGIMSSAPLKKVYLKDNMVEITEVRPPPRLIVSIEEQNEEKEEKEDQQAEQKESTETLWQSSEDFDSDQQQSFSNAEYDPFLPFSELDHTNFGYIDPAFAHVHKRDYGVAFDMDTYGLEDFMDCEEIGFGARKAQRTENKSGPGIVVDLTAEDDVIEEKEERQVPVFGGLDLTLEIDPLDNTTTTTTAPVPPTQQITFAPQMNQFPPQMNQMQYQPLQPFLLSPQHQQQQQLQQAIQFQQQQHAAQYHQQLLQHQQQLQQAMQQPQQPAQAQGNAVETMNQLASGLNELVAALQQYMPPQ